MKKLNHKQLKYPNEIKEAIIKEIDLDYISFLKYYNICTSGNVFISFNCINCNIIVRRSFKSLKKRKLIKKPLCSKCVMKEVGKNEKWLKANSDAQKKIQSTPEQKMKNSIGVSKFWKENPEIKRKMGENVRKAYNKESVRKKHRKSLRNSHSLCGEFLWRNKKITFESSYELSFLIQTINIKRIIDIKRCDFEIKYIENDKNRFYNPDFIVNFNNKITIVEIKSNWILNKNVNNFDLKKKATNYFIKNNKNYCKFLIIDEDWFKKNNMWVKRSSGIKPIVRKLFIQDKLKLFSDKKIKKYLGNLYEDKKNN